MSAKISVVIPVYNPGEYLIPCLESVIAQSVFDSMELLLIDDGSSDGSSDICDSYAERYKSIRVFHQQNSGVSAARNTGIDNAKGEFIGFVDSDDLIEPLMYERLLSAAEKTGADIAFCSIHHPCPDGDVFVEYPFPFEELLDKEKIRTDIADFMLRNSTLNSLCNKLFSKKVIGGSRLTAGRKYGEDRELFLKALAKSQGVCSTDYVGYIYRYVETSAVHKPKFDYSKCIFEKYESDKLLFAELGIDSGAFCRKAAAPIGNEIVGNIYFVCKNFKKSTRKRVLESIINDDEFMSLLDMLWDEILKGAAAFEIKILSAIRSKSVMRINLMLDILFVKERLAKAVSGLLPSRKE